MITLFDFIINLLITATAYLLIPVILILRGRKYSERKIKKIIIINACIVWIIFMVIRINAGIEGTSAAVFLWSYAGYLLMKRKCLQEDSIPQEIWDYHSEVPVSNSDSLSKTSKDTKDDFKKENCKRKSKKSLVVITILAFLLLGSIILNVFLYTAILKKENQLIAQEQEASDYIIPEDYYEYKEFWNENNEKLLFFDDNIVFVIEGDDTYYYTYNQMMNMIKENEGLEITYWAYNEEQAIYLGYERSYQYMSFEEYTKMKTDD